MKAWHQLTALLQGRDEGQGRFGTLVGVGACGSQSVEAAAGCGIVHRHAAVVAAEEPSYGAPESGRPMGVLGEAECTGTGIGDGGRLDGLLVEAWPGAHPPTGVSERWSSSVSMSRSQSSWSRPVARSASSAVAAPAASSASG